MSKQLRSNPVPLIYILSPSYSGSTLLTFLLGQHPDIATVGELKGTAMGDVNEYRCSCGELILECPFWQQVETDAVNRGLDFDVRSYGTHFACDGMFLGRLVNMTVRGPLVESIRGLLLRLDAGSSKFIDRVIGTNASLMDIIVKIQNARMFLDGSKDPRRLDYFLKSEKFQVKVIRLLRDGRGVASSFAKNKGLSFSEGVRAWTRISEEIDRVFETVPKEDGMTISYESVCESTDETLAQLARFVGLDSLSAAGTVSLDRNHVVGNRMRLAGTTEIKLNESWRQRLSESDLTLFEKLGGDRNRQLGYR